jgi:alanyl-tRNA synthetase
MKAQEIREKFTTYFEKLNHIKIESSPIVPQNDPTILFANAGMNQFKDNFTGKANPKNKRATTIQKCVRAGGKHNDLENVGFTARHHTFFEMLGNFSFGDYFKSEAIKFAWNFLTIELKIPKEKLYITVHTSDKEAAEIWHTQEGIPKDRIFFLGDSDNFWEMGDVGPCGPSSEIFYDHGIEHSDGNDTTDCILADEGRYIEIWNLVFMQYEKYKEGNEIKRRELPKPSVDTGAGLERIAALMQGVYWNYDSDIFTPIISSLEKLSGKSYKDEKYKSNFRVVSDHVRASVMLITDGVMPGSDGRGYVLRRIIRRGIRNLEELGLTKTSFYKLVPSVFESLGKEYPQNASNSSLAEKLLTIEEEKFRTTLKTGLELIKKELPKVKNNLFAGHLAFKLYDTYGFPVDLTEVILRENNMKLDHKGFESSMQKQKESSKKTSSFTSNEDDIQKYYQIKEKYGSTEFTGYTELVTEAKLVGIEKQGEFTALIFDKTPFYAESGGQAGDQGKILALGKLMSHMDIEVCLAQVVDTQKPIEGLHVHFCKDVKEGVFEIGAKFELCVSKDKRELTARHHSATHLLQSALIKVLGDHVKQAGSGVSFDRLRFDFTHPEALSKSQIDKVEKLVNQRIQEALKVTAKLMTKDEATQKGAMALFGEKYGDEVRVLEMGDFSLELCGGIHVENTKDIGLFTINFETSLSSGVRRIEAFASSAAYNYLTDRSLALSSVEKELSAKGHDVMKKLKSLQADLKDKNKIIKDLNDKIQSAQGKDLFNNVLDLGKDFGLVSVDLKNGDPKDFRNLSDKFVDSNKKDVLFLYTLESDKISYILRTNKSNKTINCSNVIKQAQVLISGRGGGRPDMAQGSGELEKAQSFIDQVQTLLKEL